MNKTMQAGIVTYSRNVFIPLTDSCRNICAYCAFRSDNPRIMPRNEVVELLSEGARAGCKEALFTFGEKPEKNPSIKEALEGWEYGTVIEYLHDLCMDAISLGLLPHSNPGSIAKKDLALLKDVNASMGLMLESMSERLCQPGMPHDKSPGKRPDIRLDVLKDAGKLEIPFTTGLLIGIGESDEEVQEALCSILKVHERHGHIQEIIIQNFRPKPGTPMQGCPEPSLSRMIRAVEMARELFPESGVQVPPNLNPGREGVFLCHGANDFGGVSSITPDYVNPQDPWPTIENLNRVAQDLGFVLRERLPVYPGFINLAPERLRTLIETYIDERGLVR